MGTFLVLVVLILLVLLAIRSVRKGGGCENCGSSCPNCCKGKDLKNSLNNLKHEHN